MGLFSTGQWLSIPLILFGFYLIFRQSKLIKSKYIWGVKFS